MRHLYALGMGYIYANNGVPIGPNQAEIYVDRIKNFIDKNIKPIVGENSANEMKFYVNRYNINATFGIASGLLIFSGKSRRIAISNLKYTTHAYRQRRKNP